MGYFSGIGNAKVSMGGAYYPPGKYVTLITACKIVSNRNSEDLFTVETEVKESNNPEVKPGEKRTYQCKVKSDSFLGNVKAFLGACNGADPNNETQMREVFADNKAAEDAADFAIDEKENPLAGTWLNLTCTNKKTKKSGYKDDFTVHSWTPYPQTGQTPHPDFPGAR